MFWRRSRLEHKVDLIIANQEAIMSALDDLTSEVSLDVASIQAAIAKIGAGTSDAAQLVALTKSLSDARAALDAAVAATSS